VSSLNKLDEVLGNFDYHGIALKDGGGNLQWEMGFSI